MKYIITEEQSVRLYVKRRIGDIMKYVRSTPVYINPCYSAKISHYLVLLKKVFFETIPFSFYVEMNMISDKDFVWDMIMSIYGDEIVNNYNEKCKGE